MTEFRYCDFDEKEIILKGMTKINKERNQSVILGIAIFSFLFAFLLLLFAGIYYDENTREVKRFTGGRPQFEKYETYIMSSIYPSKTDYLPLFNDDGEPKSTDKIDMYTYFLLQDISTTYSQNMKPEEYDYSKLDFDRIDRRSYTITYEPPKNSAEYDELVAEVKVLFDKEIDSRVALAKIYSNKVLFVCIPIVILYVLGCILIYTRIKKTGERRIDEIKTGRALVAKAVLFGRERVSRYRRSSLLYVESQAEDGEKYKLRVASMQYEAFDTNKPCFLIKYKDEYGTYDEFDVVWEGLE